MATISVVINTLNADRLLNECLQSVKQADEIVICDMYSEDKTIEIAQKHGCKIVYHERTGIVEPARNWAMEQASGDWILVLDADEMVKRWLALSLPERQEHLAGAKINKRPIGARSNDRINGITETA